MAYHTDWNRATIYWTEARVLAGLRRFYAEEHRWPVTFDFQPQVRPAYLPHFCTLLRVCASLAKAIQSAKAVQQQCLAPALRS
jgi:hypothetical protein